MSLSLKMVAKRFQENTLFSNLSYEFDDKGLYFIVGESGVGKTTLLRIIAGLDPEFDGTVVNGGITNVSFMFQEYRLFPTLSALKNAAISVKSGNTDLADSMLKRLGFTTADMKKKPRQLSGGMKQRVAFVRAVIKESPILILDEPTKELDADTVNVMMEIINEEAKRRTVIVVTHDDISKIAEEKAILRL